jgi:hypothetical protein
MSSQPSREVITSLRNCAEVRRRTAEEIFSLDRGIEEMSRKLKENRQLYEQTTKEIAELLEKMDCKSSHNNGWESRIAWVIEELVVQAYEKGQENPPDDRINSC